MIFRSIHFHIIHELFHTKIVFGDVIKAENYISCQDLRGKTIVNINIHLEYKAVLEYNHNFGDTHDS